MKIVIVGSGNAGVWTALQYGYYTRNNPNIEIELIHDPEIETFPVGQATTLDVTQLLWDACGTDWYHNEIKATPKLGLLYENFNKKKIYNPFPYNLIAIQSDPKYLQKYILNSGLFTVKEGSVDINTIDAPVIFDCRGNTDKDNIEYESLYCPVNSVLLAVGPNPADPQLWTRNVATPDGWTFIIPNTTETTSYGYLYNKDITPLEIAKMNFRETFPEASGSYSGHFEHSEETINLPFESYKAKEPIRIDSNGRKIILNGNRLAFLEPMESTAVKLYLDVASNLFNWATFYDPSLSQKANLARDVSAVNDLTSIIDKMIHEIHTFILWHYKEGSIYDTPFWRKAQEETTTIFEQPNEKFENFVELAKSISYMDARYLQTQPEGHYGQWPINSIKSWYDGYIKK